MADWDWGIIAPIVLSLAAVVIAWQGYRLNNQKADREADERQMFVERLARIEEKNLEATLSARVLHRGRNVELVVANWGPDAAQLISVEALDNPDLLVGPSKYEDFYLQPGESHHIFAAPSLATPPLVTIRIIWIGSRGEQSQDQKVGF